MADRRPKVQFRTDHDVYESFERYRSDHNRSKSEAGRELLRAGLDTKGYSATGSKGSPLEKIASPWTVGAAGLGMVIGGLLMALAAFVVTGPYTVYAMASVGAALVSVSVALITVAAVAQLVLARPMAELIGFTTEEANS